MRRSKTLAASAPSPARRGLHGTGARVGRCVFDRSAFAIPWAFQPIGADRYRPAEDGRTHGHQRASVAAPMAAACAVAKDHLAPTPTDPETPVPPARLQSVNSEGALGHAPPYAVGVVQSTSCQQGLPPPEPQHSGTCSAT